VYFAVYTLAVKKKIRAGFDMSDRTIPLSVRDFAWLSIQSITCSILDVLLIIVSVINNFLWSVDQELATCSVLCVEEMCGAVGSQLLTA
jgi:hypothetical protein